jgi:hypothetical protein
VRIKNKDDKTVIDLKGGTRGDLYIRDGENEDIIHLSGAGTISVGGKGHWARITSVSSDDKEVLIIDGGGITLGGNGYGGIIRFLSLKNKDKKEEVTVIDGQGNISLGGYGFYGQLIIKDVNGRVTSHIDGGGRIFAGTQSPPYPGYKGEIFLYDTNGRERIHLDGGLGKMVLNDINGQERILLDGETCDITLSGADCAEEFDVTENEDINPGTVLVINDDGKLSPSEKPYDKRVAGVVSGGEGYHPGIILDKNPNQNKRLPLALTGKTYCRVDAQHAPIELGDLLTTSSTPGHAMKACDPLRAFGSVIGKALRSHKENSGMIPILVALQ